MTNAQSTGTVTLRADTSSLTSGVAKSKEALQKMDEVLRRQGPALGDMSKSARLAGVGTNVLTAGVLGAVKSFGPWGLAIGVAGDALVSYAAHLENAGGATEGFVSRIRTSTNALMDNVKAIEAKSILDDQFAIGVRAATEEIRQEIWATEDAIAAANGYGESTDELSEKLLRLRASALSAEAGVRNYGETLDEFNKRAEKLLTNAAALERQADLMQITNEAAAGSRAATKIKVGGTKARGGGRPKPEEKDTSTDWEFLRELELAREAQAEKERLRAQDELDFQTMNERFDLIMQERAAAAEAAKDAAHEAEMARIDEEKRAREEQLALQERITQAGIGHTQMLLGGILSVSDARNNARRAAQAQGKTEQQVAFAVRQAELQAKAQRMQSIRDVMAMEAVRFGGLALGALASTWGIPNPSSILYFAAAAALGAGAAAAGARSNSLSDQASGMREPGGGGFGSAGFGAGGTTGGRGAPGGSSTPGAGSPIPGSPIPQPSSSTAPTTTTIAVTIQGNVIGERQEIDRLARRIEERVHSRPRRTGT